MAENSVLANHSKIISGIKYAYLLAFFALVASVFHPIITGAPIDGLIKGILILIVGLGQIGLQFDLQLKQDEFTLTHSRAFSSHKNFILLAGVDNDKEQRDIFSQTYSLPTYSSLTKALKTHNPDIVVIATSTKNIVLIGDQMQLSQPIKGTHSKNSGKSSLNFLLEDHDTIPLNRGIFFGSAGRGFVRLNFAVSKEKMKDMINSLEKGLKNLSENHLS